MTLPNDITRCGGGNCPSRTNCRRYTERHTAGAYTWYAAFNSRREAGATACDSVVFISPVTTFVEAS